MYAGDIENSILFRVIEYLEVDSIEWDCRVFRGVLFFWDEIEFFFFIILDFFYDGFVG